MDMNVYRTLAFLSGFKGSKLDEKRPKKMRTLDNPAPQKRTKTLKYVVLIHRNHHLSIRDVVELTGVKKERKCSSDIA